MFEERSVRSRTHLETSQDVVATEAGAFSTRSSRATRNCPTSRSAKPIITTNERRCYIMAPLRVQVNKSSPYDKTSKPFVMRHMNGAGKRAKDARDAHRSTFCVAGLWLFLLGSSRRIFADSRIRSAALSSRSLIVSR